MLTLEQAGRRVGDRWLWRRLSFVLDAGQSLGLAGPSGSGKTLLLRALVGLDPLDEGTVRLDDRLLDAWDLPEYRARVLYLAQTPALEEGTVEENLRRPFTFRVRRQWSFPRERAAGLLERLGDGGDLLARPVGDLSGGERKRVGFLRALLLEPRVLLLDEPTANVDPGRAEVMETLVEEWKQGGGEEAQGTGGDGGGGRAAIWTSHDAAQLARVSERQIDLLDGRPDDSAAAGRDDGEGGS